MSYAHKGFVLRDQRATDCYAIKVSEINQKLCRAGHIRHMARKLLNKMKVKGLGLTWVFDIIMF